MKYLEIKLFLNVSLQSNTYVVYDENKTCYVIDPGGTKMKQVTDFIKENELNMEGIMLTHGHYDHLIGTPDMESYKKVPVYIGETDFDFLYDSTLSLSLWADIDFKLSKNIEVRKVKSGDVIFGFEVIETPGHTAGSVCYYNRAEKMLFSGDTIFKMTHGRTDFPTGSISALRSSIKELLQLDGDVVIYPGHGASTYIDFERAYHIF